MAKRNNKAPIPPDALAAIVAAALSVLPGVERAQAEGRVYRDEQGEWQIRQSETAARPGEANGSESAKVGAVFQTAPDGGLGAHLEGVSDALSQAQSHPSTRNGAGEYPKRTV